MALVGMPVGLVVIFVGYAIIHAASSVEAMRNLEAALTFQGAFGVFLPTGWLGLCLWNLVVGLILPDEEGWLRGSWAGGLVGSLLLLTLGCMGLLDGWGALVPFIAAAIGSASSTWIVYNAP